MTRHMPWYIPSHRVLTTCGWRDLWIWKFQSRFHEICQHVQKNVWQVWKQIRVLLLIVFSIQLHRHQPHLTSTTSATSIVFAEALIMYRADLLMRCGSQGSRINKVPQPMGVYNLRRRQCYIMFFRDRGTNMDQLTFCRNYSSNCTVLGSAKGWRLWSGDVFFDLQLSFHMIFTGAYMYPKADVQNLFHPIPLATVGELHPAFINPHHPTQVNTGMHVPIAGGSHSFTHQLLKKCYVPQKVPPTNRFCFLHKILPANENPNLSRPRLNLWPSTVTVSARSMPCRAVDVKAKPNPHAASTWKCASSDAAKSLVKDSKVMAATTSIARSRLLCNALFA